jgi:hypothetical protein
VSLLCPQVAPIKISLDDIDDLIHGLSLEEIEELGTVDPDVRNPRTLKLYVTLLINVRCAIFSITITPRSALSLKKKL